MVIIRYGIRFEHLAIWQEAVHYTNKVYQITKQFPRDELFALSDQLKRSSSSIPANIAEGSGSSSKKDFCHYLDISIKSVYETVSHLYIAQDQKYITEAQRFILYDKAEILVRKIQKI